jgi:DNA-binding MurR/RpiR family transcriptional regulator
VKNKHDVPRTFDKLRQVIRDRFQALSPHLQRIARASLEEPNTFALSTTSKIAESLNVQPSTLIRFSKEFGYSGFSELQNVFRQRLIEGEPTTREQVLSEELAGPKEIEDVLSNVADANIAALNQLRTGRNTENMVDAVRLMRQARHIYVAGLRRSRPVADYLVYGLLRTEKPSSLLDFAGGMAGPQISTVSPSDVLVAIAFPPYSDPVVNAVMDANVSGRHVIAITDSADSPLAQNAQISLLVDADTKAPLQPMAGSMGLVQALLVLMGQQ